MCLNNAKPYLGALTGYKILRVRKNKDLYTPYYNEKVTSSVHEADSVHPTQVWYAWKENEISGGAIHFYTNFENAKKEADYLAYKDDDVIIVEIMNTCIFSYVGDGEQAASAWVKYGDTVLYSAKGYEYELTWEDDG